MDSIITKYLSEKKDSEIIYLKLMFNQALNIYYLRGVLKQIIDRIKEIELNFEPNLLPLATNIQNIVLESNQSIQNVKECFDEVLRYMEEEVTSNYSSFVEQSRSYGKEVESIKLSIGEVKKGIELLSDSVSQILTNSQRVSEASDNNSQGVLCIIEKNEKTTKISEDIKEISDLSTVNSEQLKSIINKFKI